jgi:hypothetical protein
MNAKMKNLRSDPFWAEIHAIMRDSGAYQNKDSLRGAVVSQVRAYSQLVDDQQEVSELFFKICDLLLDCETQNIPDPSFRYLIANLVHEHGFSKNPSDLEIQELTGLSISEIGEAREALRGQECVFPILGDSLPTKSDKKARKKTGLFQLGETET